MSENKALPSDRFTVTLDLEIFRAQMVNCLLMACNRLNDANPGLGASLVFGRVADGAVLFTLMLAKGAPRMYIFRVNDPDGSSAHLSRLDNQGQQVELDAMDKALIQTIAVSLAPTIAAAYADVVQPPVKATHPAASTLQ